MRLVFTLSRLACGAGRRPDGRERSWLDPRHAPRRPGTSQPKVTRASVHRTATGASLKIHHICRSNIETWSHIEISMKDLKLPYRFVGILW